MISKICYSCAEEKPLTEYHKHRGRKDGHSDVCRGCSNKRQSIYSKSDGAKAVRAKYWAEYKQKERDKLADYHRNYQQNFTDEQRQLRSKTSRKRKQKTPRYSLYCMLYSAAKRFPTENIATVEDLMEMYENQSGRCAVSNIEMTWGASDQNGKKMPTSISLDRIDNDKGYEVGNLRLVCWQVNVFKNCWSEEQMLAMAKAIVSNIEKSSEPTWQPHLVHSEAA